MTNFYVQSQIMCKNWDKKLATNCEVSFDYALVSHKQAGNSATSLSGVVNNLQSKESSKIDLSARFSTLHIALFLWGSCSALGIDINL